MRLFGLFGKKDRGRGFVEAVASKLGGGEVLHKPNDQCWEWRGVVGDVPARVRMGSPHAEAWLRVTQDHGSFTLSRNPDLIKNTGDSPDEAWSGDDHVRLFVGPGIFLESFAFAIGDEVEAFRALSDAAGERLVAAMPGHAVACVNLQSEEWLLQFDGGATADQVAGFLRVVAPIVVSPGRPRPDAGVAGSDHAAADWSELKMRCAYCNCIYLLSKAARCSNCGAPAR
jgi:hypothetical protein